LSYIEIVNDLEEETAATNKEFSYISYTHDCVREGERQRHKKKKTDTETDRQRWREKEK